ncbi:hypothetical protein [Planctomyces sp. SH-PL14]|uniref:hypothetical protein n=1 Tax=Planctomyces sp. SH-PL14 TaxID=1632864 RepID=UPI00078DB4B0|nr:hypothetical protein [Planctomyces sp. SH-PL14]AMV18916.1 hypothetical protein VT03_13585 [Planctomyces sp. SH-PL14]
MPFERVSPGSPQRIPARDWNGLMDMARAFSSGALDPPTQRMSGSWGPRVRNATGSDLPVGSVLAITGSYLDPSQNLGEFQRKIVLVGSLPDSDAHAGKFVITKDAIPASKMGECIVMGVAPVLVDNGDGDFADVATGQTSYLARGTTGAKVLWADDTEYEEDRFWALVAIGGGEECECVHELATAGSPSGGSIGLTYTIQGTAGSLVTVNHNHSATTIRDAIVAGNSSKLTNDNLKVYGGPLPMVSVYIRFTADLSGLFIPVPSVSNALTGTNVSPKYGIFQTPGWA